MSIKLGVHVSISGHFSNSVDNALNIGCSAFQIFTRSPRQWKTKDISKEDSEIFKEKLKNSSIQNDSVVVHMPYLPNLSAPRSEMYEKSIDVLQDEIKRCNMLGISFLVIHLGSHLGKGSQNGINQLVNGCNNALDKYQNIGMEKNKVKILLENSAGQKNSIGSTIEEIGIIFEKLDKSHYGLCFDTCHAFASGYDLTNEEGVLRIIDLIDDNIGLKKLQVIHLNDSKGEMGSNLDRHYHIGLGKIGEIGFKSFVNNKNLHNIPFIMETPIDDVRNDLDNMKYVKDLLV